HLPINEITHYAFEHLGANGIVKPPSEHSCLECTQKYKSTADNMTNYRSNITTENFAPVKMVVVDGVVMGPTHCAMESCHAEVNNYHGGVFCRHHNIQYGPKCHVKSCDAQKVAGTEACEAHKEMWNKHKSNYSSASLSGLKRALQ
ncbi:hypothetical protein BDQ17DRAFT_1220211, partial [Cyathus striatus]